MTQVESIATDGAVELQGLVRPQPNGESPNGLLVPEDEDPDAPLLSIVIPAKNEELTVTEFVMWCREGLRKADIPGEILIVDSSTDRTVELALAAGARVLRRPSRGVGQAYLDAIPYIRGQWVLMGDADCTYDFRNLSHFVSRFKEGYEFVMGSRWKGSIEPRSMPILHRYFGTPLTTQMLNVLMGSRFSDIHCGMRGITKDALIRMDLQSSSWEYASEMILKSVHMDLRTAEVPVTFLKDRNGRVSHHKRVGWHSPFYAAWINLRAMFVYGADFFLFKPGLILLALGLLIELPLSSGPLTIGSFYFSLYWQLLGVTLTLLGLQSFYMGVIVQVMHDYTGAARKRWLNVFRYTRTAAICAVAFAVGFALAGILLVVWIKSGLQVHISQHHATGLAVTGLLLMVASFMTFTSTLLMHAAALRCAGGDRIRR